MKNIIIWFIFLNVTLAPIHSVLAHEFAATDPNIILYYIANSWKSLERSMEDCNSFSDPKTNLNPILYFPADAVIPETVKYWTERCHLVVKRLPQKINKLGEVNGDNIKPAGLLYLPNPYIVPGGMFNEMYGWDSYFIVRGLIEAHKNELARGIVENFFYEIDHYGGTLNGNRTYYLSRTQLPFLAPLIRAVYTADQTQHHQNLKWLQSAYHYAVKDYNLWTHEPHLAGKTGLSRYYDFGSGPVSELAQSKSYYSDIIRYFLEHPKISQPYLFFLAKDQPEHLQSAKIVYTITLCSTPTLKHNKKYNVCKVVKNVGLSEHFYKGDRAMRASGFDTSFRFGPFSADTLNYAPVDLNSLLYKTEKDLEWMSNQLGNKRLAIYWAKQAERRALRINRYLWNEKQGMFFDYDYINKKASPHPYATTFYPLWAKLATKSQAKRLAKNLKFFEKAGGIVTSLQHTGVQWDYPYGWAPIQLITTEGLTHYGFKPEAERIAHKFLTTVLQNYLRDKTIREKYNVVSGTALTDIQIGYKMNVIGFGWTNGVFLTLLKSLPKSIAKNQLGLNQDFTMYDTAST
ncbi:MAG: trehalase [Gammaproteobacteria bacterium]|nr:trehalase [Gammaproteobacteria bacterium]